MKSQALKQTSGRSSPPQTRGCQLQCSAIHQPLGSLREVKQGQECGCGRGQGLRLPSQRTSLFCWMFCCVIFRASAGWLLNRGVRTDPPTACFTGGRGAASDLAGAIARQESPKAAAGRNCTRAGTNVSPLIFKCA